MIVDFHVHTCGSRDSGMGPRRVIEAARRAGLDGVAVCDHDSVEVALRLAAHVAGSSIDGAPGFLVIVGEEVRTTGGEIIGYFLSEMVPPGLTPEETVDRILGQGGVVCVPHPFDRFRRSPLNREALERIAPRLHAVEGLNARNLARADDVAARDWASSHGLPCVAGSDAHTYYEIGRARTELPAFDSAVTLLDALPDARLLGGHSNPVVHLVTAVGKRLPEGIRGRMAKRGE
jgi:predicted metal-dependent phosphoesterase TrpH